jgi:dolichol-phosphate mannosyltransferase
VQLVCLGLLGEYVGRIYAAVQRRPAYFVAQDTFADTADADLTAFQEDVQLLTGASQRGAKNNR